MADETLRAIIEPNLDGEFEAWFGPGGSYHAGNPKTCTELDGESHFWRGVATRCTCEKMEWLSGAEEPTEVACKELGDGEEVHSWRGADVLCLCKRLKSVQLAENYFRIGNAADDFGDEPKENS